MVVVMAGTPAVTGCSADNPRATPASRAPAEQAGTNQAAATPPGTVGVSPAGVTTKINVPARSSEEEYFQACHAAKVWMQGRQGDRQALIEAYLAAVQAPGAHGAGTWNTPWAELPLARQAAVIVSAQAAGNDECG
ncbi:MAG: lipoprotein LpqV [Mycobacterium sp.]|nr:lipoprotein LpqV [Mycobacterium sp.]